jgi:hypothetical protein
MNKSNNLYNLLIIKNLRNFLCEQGIARVSEDSIDDLENYTKEQFRIFCKMAKAEMLMQGKKVLDGKVIEKVLADSF